MSGACVSVGSVEVFGPSYPAFVVGFVGFIFTLFVRVVVGQAAASESGLFSVVAWVRISSLLVVTILGDNTISTPSSFWRVIITILGDKPIPAPSSSSPFKFRVMGDTNISATYRAGLGDDWDLFPAGPVFTFASSPTVVLYTIFVGVRRVAAFALLFFGIGRVGGFVQFNAGGVGAITRFDIGRVGGFAQFNAGGVGAVTRFDIGCVAALISVTANWDASRQCGVL
jgi:hypothetical protein